MKTFHKYKQHISLTGYLMSLGYEFQNGEGLKYPVYLNRETNDKVYIIKNGNTSEMGYQNQRNPGDKGSLIDFVISRTIDGTIIRTDPDIYKHVNNILEEYLNNPVKERVTDHPKVTKSAVPFTEMLERLEHKAFLYARKLTDLEIDNCVFIDRIFNPGTKFENYGNVNNILFPLYSRTDKIVGISVRNKSYKTLFLGSNKSNGIWKSNTPEDVKTLIVTESAIDCLSFAALYRNPKYTMYASAEGSFTDNQIRAILNLIADYKIEHLFLGFDNDAAGAKYALRFMLIRMREMGISWKYSVNKSTKLHINLFLDDNNIAKPLLQIIESSNLPLKLNGRASDCISIKITTDGIKIICDIFSYKAIKNLSVALNKAFNLNIKQTSPLLNDWNDDLIHYKSLHKRGLYISYSEMKHRMKQSDTDNHMLRSSWLLET
ncbi:MAG: toprim domain-containing protein [Bacteroidales bacterium]